jgi:hypothetical protein
MTTLEKLEAELNILEKELVQKKKTIEDDLKILKQKEAEVTQLRNDLKFKDFDEIMKKYYTHKLPEFDGTNLTCLYNYWNNKKDEDNMRDLFNYAEMDRYRTYDVAELLWECGCAEHWLEERDISEKTRIGLRFWYDLQFPQYLNEQEFQEVTIKNITNIPEEEREAVQEYMRLFYNIICNSCECDW